MAGLWIAMALYLGWATTFCFVDFLPHGPLVAAGVCLGFVSILHGVMGGLLLFAKPRLWMLAIGIIAVLFIPLIAVGVDRTGIRPVSVYAVLLATSCLLLFAKPRLWMLAIGIIAVLLIALSLSFGRK